MNVVCNRLFLVLTLSTLQVAARHGCDLEERTFSCKNVTSLEINSGLQDIEMSMVDSVNIFGANISFLAGGIFPSKSKMSVKQVRLRNFTPSDHLFLLQLSLTSSRLSELSPESLSVFNSSLLILDLSDNLLTSFPTALSSLIKLSHLDLSYNKITNIDQEILRQMKRWETSISLEESKF